MSAVTSFFPVNSVFGKDYKLVDLRTHCKGKKVGLLFSAYWCKPCREMTPEIIKYYEENKGGKEFEIIYVSTDVNEVAFNTYFAKMPWLALDYNETVANENLKAMYNVQKLPSLVVVDGDTGKVLVKNALTLFTEDLVEIQKSGKSSSASVRHKKSADKK